MTERVEIKGLDNALKVAGELLKSGYSVHMPFLSDFDNLGHNNRTYYVIEYVFSKFDEVGFKVEDDY